jgi:hypothetical protein
MRDYKGSQKNGFNLGPRLPRVNVSPKRDATPVDYIPDGTGRDLYIIRAYGLKRNYRSYHRNFEQSLRTNQATPIMDTRQM